MRVANNLPMMANRSVAPMGALAVAMVVGLQAQRWVMHPDTAAQGWGVYAALAVVVTILAWCWRPPHPGPAVLGPTRAPRRWLFLAAALVAGGASIVLAEKGVWPLVSLLGWGISLVTALLAVRGWRATPSAAPSPPFTAAEMLVVAALLAVAGLARVSWIDTLPPYYFNDEPRVGAYLLKALRGGEPFDAFRMGWNTWARLGIWVQGGFIPWFGLDLTTLRLSSALAGTVAVGTTYLLARELFGPRMASMAGLLLAIGRTGIDFSRVGVCHAQVMALAPLAFWCWWHGIRTGSAASYLGCGITLGAGVYSYNAGHILLPLWLGWVGLGTLAAPRQAWGYRYGFFLVLCGFVLATGTWFFYVTDHFTFQHTWGQWTHMARSRQVTGRLFELWQTQGLQPALAVLGEQARLTWLGFTVVPDASYGVGYRGGGMLDQIAAPLFVFGLAVCVGARRAPHLFLLYWLLPTSIAGGVLTGSPPAVWRLVGIVPLLSLLAAMPLEFLLGIAPTTRGLRSFAGILVVALLGASAVDNWRTYFIDFGNSDAMLDSASFLVHDIDRLPPKTKVLLVGADGFFNLRSETFAVHFHDRELDDIAEPGDVLPLRTPIDVDVTLVLVPNQVVLTAPLLHLYPQAAVEDRRRETTGELIYRMVHLDAPSIAAQNGLRQADSGAVGDPFVSGAAAPDTYVRRWHGQVFWPSDLPVQLELTASNPTHVDIEGVKLTPSTPSLANLVRPRGWLDITIDETVIDPAAHPVLAWLRGDGVRPLTRWDLRPGGPPAGLHGHYDRSGRLPLDTIDSVLDMDTLPAIHPPEHLPTTLPFFAYWAGTIFVPEEAAYELRILSSAPYDLTIDGTTACNLDRVSTVGFRTCNVIRVLEAGPHELHAWWDGTDPSLVSHELFQLAWRRIGEDPFQLVPFTAPR